MTREILFRGKRLNNGEWLYGLYDDEEHSADFPAIIPNRSERGKYADWAVAPATVGQYTGLTDKNGKKIFEGDIVCFANENNLSNCLVVDWIEFSWCLSYKKYEWSRQYLEKGQVLKVIGNIHDNPELLE